MTNEDLKYIIIDLANAVKDLLEITSEMAMELEAVPDKFWPTQHSKFYAPEMDKWSQTLEITRERVEKIWWETGVIPSE